MTIKKNQKIVIIPTQTKGDTQLYQQGLKVAEQFKKELSVVLVDSMQSNNGKANLEDMSMQLWQIFQRDHPFQKFSIIELDVKKNDLPVVLADEYEAILILTTANLYKKFASAVTNSPIPFLFVNPESTISSFQNIVLPLDLRKENADSTLWCSWFGRFCISNVIVVAANDKSADSKKQVQQNVMLTKRLFDQTKVGYKIYKGQKSSLFNSYEAADFALNSNSDLLILLGSSTITPLDWLIGLPERKIIKRAGKMPVLLVNPRRYNYILCD